MTSEAQQRTPDEEPLTELPAESHDQKGHKIAEHASLKYSLLGPSLTKAGQDSVDQSKASKLLP